MRLNGIVTIVAKVCTQYRIIKRTVLVPCINIILAPSEINCTFNASEIKRKPTFSTNRSVCSLFQRLSMKKTIISFKNWKDLAWYCCFNNKDFVLALS